MIGPVMWLVTVLPRLTSRSVLLTPESDFSLCSVTSTDLRVSEAERVFVPSEQILLSISFLGSGRH
jgi:hypothetical protein